MYTQNTPIHVKLWHRQFWCLAVANLLLMTAVYLLIPVLPSWLQDRYSSIETSCCIAAYAIGIVATGSLCSYLVQKYRRNLICIDSIILLLVSLLVLWWLQDKMTPWWVIAADRLIMGAALGMAEMILTSTLIIDVCESFQRTEANYAASWFGRLSLAIGPFCAIMICKWWTFSTVLTVAAACALVASFLVKFISFPFKAPTDDLKLFSFDRFFLTHGTVLFLNMLLGTVSVGLVLSLQNTSLFYCTLLAGFFLTILSQKFVFENAELKSEIVTGLVLMGTSYLLLMSDRPAMSIYVAPVMMGAGLGIIASRFMLFFIKLSAHCQRGTSQSTYFLAWEIGITLGLSLGCLLSLDRARLVLLFALSIALVAIVMYICYTHSWYLKHKNR